jgi:polyisoprenoid-binding protein YceI
MRKLHQMGAALVLAVCIVPTRVNAAEYVVDPARSELVVYLSRAGLAKAFAGDHVVRATQYAGGATVNSEDLMASSLWIEVDVESMVADEPGVRKKYGLQTPVDEDIRTKIHQAIESNRQMDVKRFPKITFESTSITMERGTYWRVTGDLTIHGVTRTVSFVTTIYEAPPNLFGYGMLSFKQSDFGITPYSTALGTVRNEDEVTLYLEILLTPHMDILAAH